MIEDMPQQQTELAPLRGKAGRRAQFLRRFRRRPGAVLAFAFLLVVVVASLLAPWIVPHDPNAADLWGVLEGSSADHWLGTDDLGRDMLSRILVGMRLSVWAAVQAVIVALLLGIPPGLVAGFVGGSVDTIISRVFDALMSFPGLVLAIAIVGFLGPSLTNAMISIGIVYAPRIMRVVRGTTLAVREETFVERSRALGSPTHRTLRRHVVPNILSPLVVEITLALGLAILAEASLSYLGLGVQPPQASLGALLGRQFRYLDRTPLNVIAPGLLIMLIVLSFNVFGDGVRDAVGREERRA